MWYLAGRRYRFVLKMINFAFKTMDSVLKMMNFVFKTMIL